jgi:hypothetical protein
MMRYRVPANKVPNFKCRLAITGLLAAHAGGQMLLSRAKLRVLHSKG